MANKNNETKEVEKNVIHIIDLKDETGELISVPVYEDYKGERDYDKYPNLVVSCGDLLEVITDIREVIYLIQSGSVECIRDAYGEQIYTDDYEDDDCNYRPYSDYEVFKDALKSFKEHGCCYRYITYDGNEIDGLTIRFLNNEQSVIKKGAEMFSAKYPVGTKAFYHKNTADDLKASQIDTIVIKHKAGCNVTTEYVMRDGNVVSENNVLMKDKALEWVETKG